MKHLGDITKIHNAPFVNCITFGSPCQGLSQAGLKLGFNDVRSGLFVEAVRIITEMREQSGGVYPAFAVWENVPGAFSTNRRSLGGAGKEDVWMTRKRFIKLCMAKGWSRNKAVVLAHTVHSNVSYEKAMHLVDFMDCIINAGCILADSISTLSSDILDVLREAMREEMEINDRP